MVRYKVMYRNKCFYIYIYIYPFTLINNFSEVSPKRSNFSLSGRKYNIKFNHNLHHCRSDSNTPIRISNGKWVKWHIKLKIYWISIQVVIFIIFIIHRFFCFLCTNSFTNLFNFISKHSSKWKKSFISKKVPNR